MRSERLFAFVLIFYGLPGYSQNYIPQNPINGIIDSTGTQNRVIFSVFDSSLTSILYYYTPYYQTDLLLTNNNGAYVSYNAIGNGSNDSVFGYITYDHLLHQFSAVEDFYGGDGGNHPSAAFNTNNAGIRYGMYNNLTGFRKSVVDKYDLNQHDWITSSTFWNPDESLSPISMWSMAFQLRDYVDYDGDRIMFDPSISTNKNTFIGCDFAFDTYIYDYFKYASGFCEQDGIVVYNAESHSWKYYEPNVSNYAFMHMGIFVGSATDPPFYQFFAYYDEPLNIWMVDTLFHQPNGTIVVKDRIISFIDSTSSGTKVHFITYDLVTHSFKKDSVSAPGADSLDIQIGTVSWIDINGTHIRGYDGSQGWGNYPTIIEPQFYLTDLYAQTGIPIIHVRNYTIGTDSVIFDFGDGTISVDNQHVLWHQYSGPGSYNVSVSSFSGGFSSTQSISFPCLTTSNVQNSCSQICNGTIEIIPPTSSPGNSILWSTGSTDFFIDSLCAGQYSFTFYDTSGCNYSSTIQVNEAQINQITTHTGCENPCSGSVSAGFTGGSGPISYLWNTGDTIPYILNACPGSYSLTVTSGNQCVDTVTITLDSVLAMNASVTGPDCYNWNNGALIFVNVTGGTPPYDCYWPYAGYSANPLHDWGAGLFELYLGDATGCVDTFLISVPNPPEIAISSVSTDPTCPGCSNGSLALSILNAIPPYTISWTPNIGNLSGDSIVNLPAGIYQITITDLNLCTNDIRDTLFQFVNIEAPGVNEILNISPNPADHFLEIQIINTVYLELDLIIIDALGKNVLEEHFTVNGSLNYKTDIAELSAGVYFIQLRTPDKNVVGYRKMIKY